MPHNCMYLVLITIWLKGRSAFSANRAGAICGGDGLACVLLSVGACGRKRGRLMSMRAWWARAREAPGGSKLVQDHEATPMA